MASGRRGPRCFGGPGRVPPLPREGKEPGFSRGHPGHHVPKRELVGRARSGERRPLPAPGGRPLAQELGGSVPAPLLCNSRHRQSQTFPSPDIISRRVPGRSVGRSGRRSAAKADHREARSPRGSASSDHRSKGNRSPPLARAPPAHTLGGRCLQPAGPTRRGGTALGENHLFGPLRGRPRPSETETPRLTKWFYHGSPLAAAAVGLLSARNLC